MFCGECGSKLEDSAKFCGECGSTVISSTENATESSSSHKTPSQGASEVGFGTFQWLLQHKTLFRNLAFILVFAVVIQFLTNYNRNSPVNALKDIVFDKYSSVEFGEVVKGHVENTKWKSDKIGKKHYQVALSGFLKEYQKNFTLVFDVTYSGEWVYAEPISITMQGETYTDWLDISLFMGTLYG